MRFFRKPSAEPREESPFEYRDPLDRTRLNHVTNDVYTRNPKGKKWHRVYAVGYLLNPSNNERLAAYGRSFVFPCGGAGSEFEPDEGWTFHAMPLRMDVPDAEEICKACRQSDAKYGKGEIPDKYRWDR